mmetsp:Transcript_12007/g.18338  ORF Transcript_12007/g.18338 Transcript_12007/m.18338 type:complete len:135 (+) Transcript_12007:108-512(+)
MTPSVLPLSDSSLIGDVIPSILSYCDAPALCNASCVSRKWSDVANSDGMWESLCRLRFGISSTEVLPPPDPTKALYILAYRQLKDVFRNTAAGGRPLFGSTLRRQHRIPLRTVERPVVRLADRQLQRPLLLTNF